MAGINNARVVVGGLLAGLLLNVGDFVTNSLLLADEFRAGLVRLGLDVASLESATVAVTWVAVDFVLGLLLVWTYAAMRPRFGPGVQTAVLAALPTMVSVTAVMFGLTGMGFFTMGLFAKSTAYSVVNLVVASAVGARFYAE